jgi:hypothetical protein
MNRLALLAVFFLLLCPSEVFVRAAQQQLTIDATQQPSPPARARAPFPGSATPGHSAGLPVRLELVVPNGKLRADRTILVDFIITNLGIAPLTLPCSVNQNNQISSGTTILTLYLTSDAIEDVYLTSGARMDFAQTSVELYGRSDTYQSLCVVRQNESVRVHASSRARLRPGTHSLTAHVELLRISQGSSELIGTANSYAVRKVLSAAGPTVR